MSETTADERPDARPAARSGARPDLEARRAARAARRARRGPRRDGGLLSSVPWSIRVSVLIVAVFLLGRAVNSWWQGSRMAFAIEVVSGTPVDTMTVSVFPAEDRKWDRPVEALVEDVVFEGAGPHGIGSLTDRDEVVLVVDRGEAGKSFVHVARGEAVSPKQVPPADVLEGRVVDEKGEPIADARVFALGGGERGVPLAQVRTDADGAFVLSSLAEYSVTVRVLADGFQVDHRLAALSLTKGYERNAEPYVLRPTRPLRGRLVLASTIPDSIDVPAGLIAGRSVIMRGVAGPVGVTDADGRFELDHLSPSYRAPLLVADLPEGWTHRTVRASIDDQDIVVVLEPGWTVSGTVLNGNNGAGVPGAVVWHTHGPRAEEPQGSDQGSWYARAGTFELERVPSGAVEIFASIRVPRRASAAFGVDPTAGSERSRYVYVDGSIELDIAPDGTYQEPVLIRLH